MNLHQYPTRLEAKTSGMFLMLRRVEFPLTELATRAEKALSAMVKVVGKILWRRTSFIFLFFALFIFSVLEKDFTSAEFNWDMAEFHTPYHDGCTPYQNHMYTQFPIHLLLEYKNYKPFINSIFHTLCLPAVGTPPMSDAAGWIDRSAD
jgi:hypothetical protein